MQALKQTRRQTIKTRTLLLLIFLIFGFTTTSDTDTLASFSLNCLLKGGDTGGCATNDDLLLNGEVAMTRSRTDKADMVVQYLNTTFAVDDEKLTSGLKTMITFLAIKAFEASESSINGASDDFISRGIKLKMDEIATACNLSRRTIIHYLQRAKQLNIIQIVGYQQQGRLNTYKLNPIKEWLTHSNNRNLYRRLPVHKETKTRANTEGI